MRRRVFSPKSKFLSTCIRYSVCFCTLALQCIGYAPEEPLVYSGLTARELAELSAALHGVAPGTGRRAAELLASQSGDLRHAGLAVVREAQAVRFAP